MSLAYSASSLSTLPPTAPPLNKEAPTNADLPRIRYQDYNSAVSQGLVAVNGTTGAVTLSVDTTHVYASDGSDGGRPSVRIESKDSVNQGLVIGDFAHMPGSVCGAWPACKLFSLPTPVLLAHPTVVLTHPVVWMYGPDWPNGGEIDIIEGANMAYDNLMSAHTSDNCALPPVSSDLFDGTQENTDCANSVYGCNYVPPTTDMSSYGSDFNAVGGGVYALQWTDEAISIWHFSRAAIPADIVAKEPDPSGWGMPQAVFGGGGCDVESHFKDMNIVLNIVSCRWLCDGIDVCMCADANRNRTSADRMLGISGLVTQSVPPTPRRARSGLVAIPRC